MPSTSASRHAVQIALLWGAVTLVGVVLFTAVYVL